MLKIERLVKSSREKRNDDPTTIKHRYEWLLSFVTVWRQEGLHMERKNAFFLYYAEKRFFIPQFWRRHVQKLFEENAILRAMDSLRHPQLRGLNSLFCRSKYYSQEKDFLFDAKKIQKILSQFVSIGIVSPLAFQDSGS